MREYRIVCFTGRGHHIDKLYSTMSYLQERGFRVDYVCANNAVNNHSFEEPLVRKGVPYESVYDYLDDAVMDRIERHARILRERCDAHILERRNLFDYVSEFWARYSFQEMVEAFELFGEVLDRKKPDLTVVLHEANFWGKMMCYQGKARGIKTLSFQEGPYRDYKDNPHFSPFNLLSEYSDRVYLWGRQVYEIFAKVVPDPSRIRVVGAPHLDPYFQGVNEHSSEAIAARRRALGVREGQKVLLFAVPHTTMATGDLSGIIRAVIEFFRRRTDLFLLLRFHPFEGEAFKAGFVPLLSGMPNAVLSEEPKAVDVIQLIDGCLLQESTTGMECLAFSKPLIELNFDPSLDILRGYHKQGLADLVTSPGELDLIPAFLERPETAERRKKREELLEYNLDRLDGRCNERIHADIQELLRE
jgi:hypothetical protein